MNFRQTVERVGAWRGLLAAMVLAGIAACNPSTAPDANNRTVNFSFSPAAQGVQVALGGSLLFAVTSTDVDTMAVNWWQGGEIRSNSPSYTFVPAVVGQDTIRAQVEALGVAKTYYWVVTVTAGGGTLPPVVPSVTAAAGTQPGDVEVRWNRVGNSSFALAEYVVALSITGPLTAANWTGAPVVRHVQPRVGWVGYSEVFTVIEDSMVPGEEVWAAVRAVDVAGQISPVGSSAYTVVTSAWWVNGRVVDDTGAVPPSVVVSSISPTLSTNIDATSGRFRLGPYRSIDQVQLQTTSSHAQGSGWFDFQTSSLDSTRGGDFSILLIKRHQLDPACGGEYGWQFLNYIRSLSQTGSDPFHPENSIFYRWPAFPLRVYFANTVNADGVNFAEVGRFATSFWDSVLAEPLFVETTVVAEAQVVFRVDGSRPEFLGLVSLLEPSGPQDDLGNVVPLKMELYLRETIADLAVAKGVALHELGHVLGLYGHANCAAAGYLMTAGNGGALGNVNPIHPDEQNAVRCLLRLGQAIDMSGYSLN